MPDTHLDNLYANDELFIGGNVVPPEDIKVTNVFKDFYARSIFQIWLQVNNGNPASQLLSIFTLHGLVLSTDAFLQFFLDFTHLRTERIQGFDEVKVALLTDYTPKWISLSARLASNNPDDTNDAIIAVRRFDAYLI